MHFDTNTKMIDTTLKNMSMTHPLTSGVRHLKQLIQVMLVPKSKLFGIVVAEVLQVGLPSCRPTNSVKALKDECKYYVVWTTDRHRSMA